VNIVSCIAVGVSSAERFGIPAPESAQGLAQVRTGAPGKPDVGLLGWKFAAPQPVITYAEAEGRALSAVERGRFYRE
jgi:hypothetical protein